MIYVFFKDGTMMTHKNEKIESHLFSEIDTGVGTAEFLIDTDRNMIYWSDGWEEIKEDYQYYLNNNKLNEVIK